MGVNTSFADYIADWRRLLHLLAINISQGLIPDMPVLRGALEAALVSLEQSTAQQDAIRGEAKDNAATSREHLQLGFDAALQLRAAIRSHLGPRNPKLTEFRVRVLGPRRPKPTLPEDIRPGAKAKPEAPEPAVEPEVPAS
ncbi:MAG TPA: hypothetical protein VF179_11345 [Thermoanaerobaculia bacterium]|nr:hypothetical protein [Thermoanaerobaculia bacterium]